MRKRLTQTPDFKYVELVALCSQGEDFEAFVSFLQQHGGLNATDENGRSALMFCIANLKNPIQAFPFAAKFAKQLIDLGVDINQTDLNDRTALHFCLQNRQDDILAVLLEHPELDLFPTVLGFAFSWQPTNLSLMRRLLQLGANPYVQADNGQSFYDSLKNLVGQEFSIAGEKVDVQPLLALIHEVCGEKHSATPYHVEG